MAYDGSRTTVDAAQGSNKNNLERLELKQNDTRGVCTRILFKHRQQFCKFFTCANELKLQYSFVEVTAAVVNVNDNTFQLTYRTALP